MDTYQALMTVIDELKVALQANLVIHAYENVKELERKLETAYNEGKIL